MRAEEFITEDTAQIPMGKGGRATHTVPKYWYHSLGNRPLGAQGEIEPYTYRGETAEFAHSLYASPAPTAFVYLSPRPLSQGAIKIDVTKLDPKLMRLTGQSEGYAVYAGAIPAEAQVK